MSLRSAALEGRQSERICSDESVLQVRFAQLGCQVDQEVPGNKGLRILHGIADGASLGAPGGEGGLRIRSLRQWGGFLSVRIHDHPFPCITLGGLHRLLTRPLTALKKGIPQPDRCDSVPSKAR
eukprot:174659-Pelagomonas_calceolata.AAC.5